MASKKPTLLLYCQHSLGMGHLVRSFSLTRALTKYYHVIFLNGGPIPEQLPVPEGIELNNLPALGMGKDSQLISKDSRYTVAEAKAIRKQKIIDALLQSRPAVLLIELFPFGRKKFADELLPLLERAYGMGEERPAVFCSLRDILVGRKHDQQKHDDRAAGIINQYFDAVLVHADPDFAKLSESFHPGQNIQADVFYTGFVSTVDNPIIEKNKVTNRRVLVSAGGGIVGMPLFRAAVQAQPELWKKYQIEMTIVAGPFLPVKQWRELQTLAEDSPGLTLIRAVSDMRELLQRHSMSVSQCGYNTVMDLLVTGCKALLVPFSEGDEDEQINRAARLEKLGVVRLLTAEKLSGDRLKGAIVKLQEFSPKVSALDIKGAENSASYISRWTALTQRRNTPFDLHGRLL